MDVQPLTMHGAVDAVLSFADAPRGTCHFVVTPNVDHAVMLREHAGLRAAYADASLRLIDGMPLVVLSRLFRKPIPERVAGSDLVPALFQAAVDRGRPLTVYLLGAGPGVAERAKERIEQTWPQVRVVGTHSPPFGFEKDPAENKSIVAKVNAAEPDVLLVGVGAPKQELWIHAHHKELNAKVALCIGATIDFLAGEKSRAPVWMRKAGLEWAHRVASEPKRLAKRYAKDAVVLPRIVFDELRGK